MCKRRMSARKQQDVKRRKKIVEGANSLSSEDFFAKFCSKETSDTITRSCREHNLEAIYTNVPGTSDSLFTACFELIKQTSAEDYKNSELKWSPAKKKQEMALPDMKYILLHTTSAGCLDQQIAGFISFMITYEDGHEVLYVYEIHLAPSWQSNGLGKLLMNTVESIGHSVGIQKLMLTVFTANDRAIKWYGHLGYNKDEYSPAPRRLRNGTAKEASYLILSKMMTSRCNGDSGLVVAE